MALPDNNQNPNLDSGPSRSPRPLWSRIAATTKTSLIFNEESNTVNEDGLTIIKSLVFRVGRTEGSIMFDITSRPEPQRDFFKIIATQFPTRWDVAFQMEGNRKIIEVQLLEAEKRQHALEHASLAPNGSVKAQPKCWECDSTEHLRHACPFKKPRRASTSPNVEPTSRDLMEITDPVVLDSDDKDMDTNENTELLLFWLQTTMTAFQRNIFYVEDLHALDTGYGFDEEMIIIQGFCRSEDPNNYCEMLDQRSYMTKFLKIL
ncbi:hypothetical protein INT47_009387 [Mucor saturninus]|uniref:Uncharacterized protein n=1 Tax=Mucor saturninus TaxID=64648 RepID=A0A8H7R645_9FUNG|nr:hypothetical protein INT47_009387 [Mucor saturninus]